MGNTFLNKWGNEKFIGVMIKIFTVYRVGYRWEKLVLCVKDILNRKNARMLYFKKSENNFFFSKRTRWSVRSHLASKFCDTLT